MRQYFFSTLWFQTLKQTLLGNWASARRQITLRRRAAVGGRVGEREVTLQCGQPEAGMVELPLLSLSDPVFWNGMFFK